MTVRVFLILPPVRMGFINHDISVFISDKFPILDFFLSPRMIRVKRAHSQKQMDMRIAIPFVVDTPISAHSYIHKCFLDIVGCILNLFLSAPFFWKGKFK